MWKTLAEFILLIILKWDGIACAPHIRCALSLRLVVRSDSVRTPATIFVLNTSFCIWLLHLWWCLYNVTSPHKTPGLSHTGAHWMKLRCLTWPLLHFNIKQITEIQTKCYYLLAVFHNFSSRGLLPFYRVWKTDILTQPPTPLKKSSTM